MPRVLSSRYRLIERIDEGGASPVWRAHDEVLRRRVAVRLFGTRPGGGDQPPPGARVAALLNHPNVSAVHDYGVADGTPYVVTELVEGDRKSVV